MPSQALAHISEDRQREQTVLEHLQNTAKLAKQFAKPFGAEQAAQLAGLLHDLGKYSEAFQRRLLENGPKVDHSTAGAQLALELCQNNIPIAFAVAGHHTGIPDGGNFKLDTEQTSTLFGRRHRNVPAYSRWKDELVLPAAALPSYCTNSPFAMSFFTRMLYSCLVDADYLDTEAFMQGFPPPRGSGESLESLRLHMREKADSWLSAKDACLINQKRNTVLKDCISNGAAWPTGLYTLTVPTGGGKTFDSLAFALEHAVKNHMSRIIYIIPYTSIIDQTVETFRDILGDDNVLAHHSGADYLLREDGELAPADYRKALAAENWDAPVIVTTAVQFFESLYANRSGRCRKLHNIANSVLIFDEAQTIPISYLRPCVAAISQLVQNYHSTAVLCTATQPALEPLFAEFLPGTEIPEICPAAAELYISLRRTVIVDAGTFTQEELVDRLSALPQVLCVVNRRKTAQELYQSLPAESRYCLTTLLCAADRKQLLEEIRRRLKACQPCRVVSTSLIEAGVDVDFPAVYREEAGLDSIIQTAGRCNREGKRTAEDSPVYIFKLEGCTAPTMLAQNLAALHNVQRRWPGAVDRPEAISAYFTALRGIKGNRALDKQQILPAFTQGIHGVVFPFAQVAERFRLIDSPTRTIYLPIDDGAALCSRLQNGERSRAIFRQLGIYSVSVYPQHYDALYAAGALEIIDGEFAVLTDTNYYSRKTGLTLEVETGKALFDN